MVLSIRDSVKIFRREFNAITRDILNQQKQEYPGNWYIMNRFELAVKL